MILTVFRSRLNEGIQAEYDAHVETTAALVESTAGFASHKLFVAEDGERITLVEFESLEAQRAWSLSQAHVEAAKAGRKRFYSEYKIQVCSVLRESKFNAADAPAPVPSTSGASTSGASSSGAGNPGAGNPASEQPQTAS